MTAANRIMRTLLILFTFICSQTLCWSQTTRVKVGDLYYNLSGSTAAVTTSDIIPIDCRTVVPSKYTNDRYVIPAHIQYEGLDYEVTAIDKWAFAGFRNDAYASPTVHGATGSTAKEIILPPTIKRIGESAFANCKNLIKMIIPASVEYLYSGHNDFNNVFFNTPLLRELIYLSETPPSGWHATSKTFVPNLNKYKNPYSSITDASISPILYTQDSSFEYSGEEPKLTIKTEISNYDISFTSPTWDKNAGKYDQYIKAIISNNNYSYDSEISIHYEITPKPLKISVTDTVREYGEPNPNFEILYDGFVEGEDKSNLDISPIASTTASQKSNIGKYEIFVKGASSKNYSFEYTNGVLTIDPAPLSASVIGTVRSYGNNNPYFTLDYTGLKNNETEPAWIERPVFSTVATESSPVGEYEVTAIAIPQNYILSGIAPNKLKVIPAVLTISANNKSRLFFDENPELNYCIGGFKNGEDSSILTSLPTLSTNAKLTSNAGSYDINIEGASAPNYNISYQKGTLIVEPRTLSVSVGNYDRYFGEENPSFDLIYNGFVADNDVSTLIKLPTATTAATKTSNVGTYPIYISGGEAANYKFEYKQGWLSVSTAYQEIIWNQELSNLAIGQQVELTGYATSGLDISYLIENNDVCEVYSVGNKKYLDCKNTGEAQIRAIQNGNGNFYSAPRISKTIKVSSTSENRPSLTIKALPVGSMSTNVDWGTIYTFKINSEPNWVISSITLNGIDYSSKLDEFQSFTTPPITTNTSIIVTYKDNSSSINDIETDAIKVFGTQNGINVIGCQIGETIHIYSIEGYLIKSIKTEIDNTFIELPNNQTYIVKIQGNTYKLRI